MDWNLFALFFQLFVTPVYKLVKFSLNFLTPSTFNEYTVIHSLHFTEEICQEDPNVHMASLDVDSLFTTTPLDQAIDICVDKLYSGKENPTKISKHDFSSLINTATKKSLFTFRNKYCKQVDRVAMGSPFHPASANIFMCSF